MLLLATAVCAHAVNGVADLNRIFNSDLKYHAVMEKLKTVDPTYSGSKAAYSNELAAIKNEIVKLISRFAWEKELEGIYDVSDAHVKADVKNTMPDVTAEIIELVNRERNSKFTQAAADADKNRAPLSVKQPPQTTQTAKPIQTPQIARTVPAQPIQTAQTAKPKSSAAENPVQQNRKIILQFGAYDKKYMADNIVARTRKAGINARTEQGAGRNGRTVWRARATAESKADADAIIKKLGQLRLKYYIVQN